MIVGILKEIKTEENRVCMTPAGVEVMIHNGHDVLVEKNAGAGSGFADEAYVKAGAKMVDTPKEIFAAADMVMHVKEPLPPEYDLIRQGQIVFTYLHLAADETQTRALIKSRSVSIAYETIQKADGSLPLLTPMSEVAGRMAIQQGAKYLEMAQGGHGVLLGGVPGVDPGTVVVIGGGVVGVNAAKMACGPGGQGLPAGHEPGPAALPERRHAGQLLHLDVQPGDDPQAGQGGRRGGGCGADSRGQGAAAGDPRDAGDHEEGLGAGGRGHRPGGLLRDLQGHHPRRAHLRGGRGDPLLRGQHARRGGQDLDPGADQRHLALCGADRQQGLEEGHAGEPRDPAGGQRDRRQGHLPGRRRGLRYGIFSYRRAPMRFL